MTALLIFIGVIIALNSIPFLTKATFPKVEKGIKKVLVLSTFLFSTLAAFQLFGYRLKGVNLFSGVCWIFIIATIAYFVIFPNTRRKIAIVFLLAPLVVVSFFFQMVGRLIYENEIDESNRIIVTTSGFLACGDDIHITQPKFGIFEKKVFRIDNLCLTGINNIEIIEFDDEKIELLIHHSGKYDSENPYRYELKREF